MVRVGAKRERPCMVLLHVALRSAPLAPPAPQGQGTAHAANPSSSTSPAAPPPPENFIWKSQGTAEVYASAVLSRVRAWWELLGGVRYGLPDSVRLASVVWDGAEAPTATGTKTAAPAATSGGAERANEQQQKPAVNKRQRRGSAAKRRSGVLRCAVQLSRSLYGDTAALHVFRAACACVTEAHVSMPLSRLSPGAVGAGVDETEDGEESPKRRRQRVEDSGPRMEQSCHAAVRVARIEHVVSRRQR